MIRVDFEHLKEEKRLTILNAALEEFAVKGYALASTNEIVKRAGISKGALYSYFPSKRDLYVFLCDYAEQRLRMDYLDALPAGERDLLKRLHAAAMLKTQLISLHPQLFSFLSRALVETDPEAHAITQARLAEIAEQHLETLYRDVDTSLFRQDLPPEDVLRLICWTLDGYSAELTRRMAGKSMEEVDLEQENAAYQAFQEHLRSIYYRRGGKTP